MTRLCKDCLHVHIMGRADRIESYYCTINKGLEPVLGKFDIGIARCIMMRAESASCGPDGRLWFPQKQGDAA